MPGGQYAKPFNMGKNLRDLQGRIPNLKEAIDCPVSRRTFDRFATIELLDEGMQGEIDYYCPHCDTLVLREFRGPGRQSFEIVDGDHKIEAK